MPSHANVSMTDQEEFQYLSMEFTSFTTLLPESLLKIIQRFLRPTEIRGSFVNSLCRVKQTIVIVNRLFSLQRNVTRVDLRGVDAQ